MGIESEDIEFDNDFDRELEQKRHAELLEALNAILNKPSDDRLLTGLGLQIKTLEKVLDALSKQPKPDAPVVNIETDNSEIIKSFKDIAQSLSKDMGQLQSSIDNMPRVWEFTIVRNRANFLEKIKAEAKSNG